MHSNHQRVGQNYGTDSSLELMEGNHSPTRLDSGCLASRAVRDKNFCLSVLWHFVMAALVN